jgi:signal transduction histidine kinase
MSEYLQADWGATFLADAERGSFRIVGATAPEIPLAELGRIDFPLHGWADLARLETERIVVLDDVEAERVPTVFTGGRTLGTVLIARLHRGDMLAGFLAVGYHATDAAASHAARRLVAGIAEHAATVLHNARLLSEIQLAADLKSEFVGAVSHELRSPLNVIIGYAEMLRDGEMGAVTADQAGALDRTHRQAVALLEMITALLDLNRWRRGGCRSPRRRSTCRCCSGSCWSRSLPRGVGPASCSTPARAPHVPTLVTDPGKLKTILRNLVHNALKFTPAGEVVVEAAAVEGGVAFTVRDTGVGIPDEALPYVFEMFRQVPGMGGGGVGTRSSTSSAASSTRSTARSKSRAGSAPGPPSSSRSHRMTTADRRSRLGEPDSRPAS